MKLFKQYWLYLLIAALPFERIPSYNLTIGSHSVTIRISFVVAALALLLFGYKLRPKWSPSRPIFWMTAYLLICVLSSLFGLNHGRSITAIVATTLVVATAVLISENLHFFKLQTIFKILTVVTVGVCLFGIYQFIGDTIGIPTAFTGLKLIYTKAVFGFPRVQSTGLEPLFFANFLLIPFISTLTLLYANVIRGRRWYGVLFLYILTMALTLSRGGFAGTALASIIVFVVLRRQTSLKRLGLVTCVGIFACLTALGFIYASSQFNNSSSKKNGVSAYVKQSTHVTSEVGSGDNDRVTNRRLAVKAFRVRPLLGVGLAGFGTYAKTNEPNYRLTNGEVVVNNEYLEVLAETGLLGGIAILGLLLALVTDGIKVIRNDLGSYESLWLVSLIAILLGMIVQYYAFSTLYIMHIWVVVGLLIGLTRIKQTKVISVK